MEQDTTSKEVKKKTGDLKKKCASKYNLRKPLKKKRTESMERINNNMKSKQTKDPL